MSKKNQNKISIPIIKNGKDICRLIFTKDESMPGCYDLKIDMRKNLYEVWTYRMFARCPIIWDVDDSEKVSMSYHHGANDNPIMIHLKNESLKGAASYRTLPAQNILAPNTNTMFPIPLCKLEIPENTVEHAAEYKSKSYHHLLNIGDMNAVEFYMVADDFSLDDFLAEKYSTICMCHMGLSIDYYASYTVLSDYSKNAHFAPEPGVPEERFVAIGGLQGMKLLVSKFKVPEINNVWDKLHMTFVENKYAEDMLLCTLVRYVERYPWLKESVRPFYGGASLDELKPPAGPFAILPVLPESCVEWDLKRNTISSEERKRLQERAGLARANVYRELRAHEKFIREKGEYYRKKAYEFRKALMQSSYWHKLQFEQGECYMMFAKYIGLCEYVMHEQSFFFPGDSTETISYYWLVIDDYLQIEIFRDSLNVLLKDKDNRQVPVVVSRAKYYGIDETDGGIRPLMENAGFVFKNSRFGIFKENDVRDFFESSGGLYKQIIEKLN